MRTTTEIRKYIVRRGGLWTKYTLCEEVSLKFPWVDMGMINNAVLPSYTSGCKFIAFVGGVAARTSDGHKIVMYKKILKESFKFNDEFSLFTYLTTTDLSDKERRDIVNIFKNHRRW